MPGGSDSHIYHNNRRMRVVRLSSLSTGRFYPPGNTPDTHFCQRLSRPQGHSVAGRFMLTKNSNDTIGNRTRNLPVCSAVPLSHNNRGKTTTKLKPNIQYRIRVPNKGPPNRSNCQALSHEVERSLYLTQCPSR